MPKSLWIKFLVLLLAVSVIALSSALVLRELMIKDFREYMEGELEDRVYWVTADIERTYEKYSSWDKNTLAEDAVWALMLGLEIKIKDTDGNDVIDTEKAVSTLSPLIKRRVMGISDFEEKKGTGSFQPYPLFLEGKEIGTLEVRFLRRGKEGIFMERSNKFLLFSLFALGGLTVILSIIFSRKLTNPIKRLASAAKDISEGNLKSRVKITDGDEIGKLSETFNLMARNLEVQESFRKKLISNVAHELRTPISAMRGEIEGMVDGLISPDKAQLQSLYEETGRLKNLLDGIDELSQAQASALSQRKQNIELNPFLKTITDRFSKLFLDKGISLEFECDDSLMTNADPDSLSRIVINLLSNALKATEKGGNVRLIAGKKDAEVFIEVSDTGRGIKKEEIPFIFERFFKAMPGGLGLGLAIVKELVEAHYGRIEVQSEYGQGSSFVVYLPR